jgi:lysophospholipase L1-like esterase
MIRGVSRRSAAWGSGGMAGAVAASLGVLVAQARAAKRDIGPQRGVPPYQDGRFGPPTGTSIRLAVLGDSVAAGLGADTAADTVAGVLVRGVAEATKRPVTMTNHAVVGARSADLERQVTRCLSARPHVAVIIIGANDVTHLVPQSVAVRRLETAIVRLIDAGTAVVIGTCPDLGTVRPVGPPLKWVAREMSRSLAVAQRRAAVRAGARPVNLYDLLGPEFDANAETFFGPDRFHPSSMGYRRIGATLLPAVLAALNLTPSRARRAITASPS